MNACCGDESDEVSSVARAGRSQRQTRFVWLLIIVVLATTIYWIKEKQDARRGEVVNAMKQLAWHC
ncbi:hypothetical protein ACFQY0_06055 [Haloferula chungangensis]|uniref:Uncharacterized protein n=1 Tax=Haloferula chungangensis TaxID=1048331 RepID=A0ABW2L342_9BACT